MGTFSKSLASCGGFIAGDAEVIEFLKVQSRAFLFTASGVPAAVGAALAALRVIRSDEGRELLARVLENGRHLNRGLHELGFDVVEPSPVTNAAGVAELIITPIVPVRVGEDWKAGLLWRALWDAGVFTNVAVHPAVAARRRAAAHERDGHPRQRGDRPRAGVLREGQARVRGRARPAARPGRLSARTAAPDPGALDCAFAHKRRESEKPRSERMRTCRDSLTTGSSAAYRLPLAWRGGAGGL